MALTPQSNIQPEPEPKADTEGEASAERDPGLALHPLTSKFARIFLSLVLGLLCGVFLHYMIYRLSLPSQPFIYANF